jgi:hypothetical protein
MSASREDKEGQIAAKAAPSSDFDVVWKTESFSVRMGGAAVPIYLKPGSGHTLIASAPGSPAIHCALYTRPASFASLLAWGGGPIL